MTFEKQCFLGLSEVRGIEIRCSRCGYRWIRPVENWQQDSTSCANCQQIWFLDRSGDLATIKDFVASLGRLRELEKRAPNLGFSLRLEVECPPEKGTGT